MNNQSQSKRKLCSAGALVASAQTLKRNSVDKIQRGKGARSAAKPSSAQTGQSRNNEVGYGRPPVEHRFKPGQSGNPKGRNKGRKNEATILQELLFQKIKLRENGRVRSISLLEAIYRRAADDALKGNLKAMVFLLSRYFASLSDNSVEQSDLNEDDEAVLKKYARQVLDGLPG